MKWLLLLLPVIAFAGPDEIIQSNDMNNQTAGEIILGGNSSKAFAFGHALGDVDIAQCLGSTQWDTLLGGRQKLVLNNVCMAEFYLKAGKYALAAMALCNQPEILREFATEEACELAHDFAPSPVAPPAPVSVDPPSSSHDSAVLEEYVMEQQQEQAMLYEDLQAKIRNLESYNQAASRKASERRAYAQHTLEQLEDDDEER